jgi:DHA3 family tetracycline resistance protein-like MFS transporter
MGFFRNRLKAYTAYLLYSGISSFAMYTIFSINMVYQIETVKLNPLQLVLVGTTLETACFLGQVPTGVLADVYSRRMAVIVGIFLMGAGFLIEGLFPTFPMVLLAQVLWGIGSTFTNGAEEAWVADEIGEAENRDLGKVFIRGSQIGQIAALLSIPVGIWLATFRLNLPVVSGSSLLLLLAFLLLLIMPEQHFKPTPREERNSWQAMGRMMLDGGKAVRRSPMLLLILAITVFMAMASEGFDRLQTDHFIQDYSFPDLGHLSWLVWFGIISAGSMILVLAVTEVVRRCIDTSNQRTLIATMFLLNMGLIASVAAFALAGNFYLAIAMFWCASICRQANSPLYTTWITRNSDPRMRATIISMLGQVDAIGQIAGGPAVGLIGSIVSLRAALLATCATLSPNAIFFTRALQISKAAPELPDEVDEEEAPAGTL